MRPFLSMVANPSSSDKATRQLLLPESYLYIGSLGSVTVVPSLVRMAWEIILEAHTKSLLAMHAPRGRSVHCQEQRWVLAPCFEILHRDRRIRDTLAKPPVTWRGSAMLRLGE